ncbi:YjbQ family protein [Aerococcus agrisoli]|uniref:YjbQ family protein n=1 Tax=Aerococcus agrisoli TaxID=2487350 RepID=A0A3N4G7Q1_9LACT|nr:YjbQ family protein [Aerococcus agrisoli]RPA57427.1 YjbQ family protein [Aerococcus agrisoli]
MIIKHETLSLESSGKNVTYHEITDEVKKMVISSGLVNGQVVISSPHTTCSIIFEEYVHDVDWNGYEYLQVDLNRMLDRLIPRQLTESDYIYPGEEHVKFMEEISKIHGDSYPNDRSSILNADAHIRASLFGSSETFIVKDGELQIGSVGYIYFVDWDQNRKRKRLCNILLMGE